MERCEKCQGLRGERNPIRVGDMVTFVTITPQFEGVPKPHFTRYHPTRYQPKRGVVEDVHTNGSLTIRTGTKEFRRAYERVIFSKSANDVFRDDEPCSFYAFKTGLAKLCSCE